MRVTIAADHAGYLMKNDLAQFLREAGHSVEDLGTNSSAPVDYPDFAKAVGEALVNGRAERGILICGSGVGASVAANKIPGIRAAVCHDAYSAHQGVEHDNMNVLVFGSRVIGLMLAHDLALLFMNAKYQGREPGQERLQRRLDKIEEIEKFYSSPVRAGKGQGS